MNGESRVGLGPDANDPTFHPDSPSALTSLDRPDFDAVPVYHSLSIAPLAGRGLLCDWRDSSTAPWWVGVVESGV